MRVENTNPLPWPREACSSRPLVGPKTQASKGMSVIPLLIVLNRPSTRPAITAARVERRVVASETPT